MGCGFLKAFAISSPEINVNSPQRKHGIHAASCPFPIPDCAKSIFVFEFCKRQRWICPNHNLTTDTATLYTTGLSFHVKKPFCLLPSMFQCFTTLHLPYRSRFLKNLVVLVIARRNGVAFAFRLNKPLLNGKTKHS